MSTRQKVLSTQTNDLRRSSLTIALFLENVNEYHFLIWSGIADIVRDYEMNLMTFVGSAWQDPHNPMAQGNVIYDLANEEILDGLIPTLKIRRNIKPC